MKSPETPTPAARLIRQFGAKRLADWSGRHRTRVYRWAAAAAAGGSGGVVPPRLRDRIIAGARRELGVELAHGDFELHEGERYLFGDAA